ncbi:hypothetical protein DFJ73DRAFT_870942 [Zopfochytrium polystomum]|nr:hypothetical protein DFJ73DRAFT_870942 [Zopfochytrium polystomum]
MPAGDEGAGNEEGGDGDEECDELDQVSSAVIDWCLKFLLIPSPYDVPHALQFYTMDREMPALDRMLRVVKQQVEAHQSLLEWHEERKKKARTPSEATVMWTPQSLDVEVRKHFRIDGLKREVSRLKRDAWQYERPAMDKLYFAPQACRAVDVEFRDPEAVKMMAELARHGLLDRLYFRRFDMGTESAIHPDSCYNSRGRGDVGMESITPTLGDFVHPDKVVVVGDVDDLVEPLEGAKVYRSEDLKHVPKGVLQARPQDKTTFLFSHEWVSDSRYKSTESFDWPLASEDCWESYKCPAAIPTEVTVGIVFWNGDAASDDYKVPKRRPKLRVPTFFPKPMTAFQLFCHEKRSQLLLAAEESGCSVTLEEIENRIYDEWTRGGWRLREAFEFLVDLAAHSEKRFRRALGRHWRGEDMNEGFASGDETFEDDE